MHFFLKKSKAFRFTKAINNQSLILISNILNTLIVKFSERNLSLLS